MIILYVFITAVSLAMDAFAASVSCGMTDDRSKVTLSIKVGTIFGLAQFSMFVIGWMLGHISQEIFFFLGTWIAVILLVVIGSRMIIEAVKRWKKEKECRPLRNWFLIMLALATSIDAFVIGLTFAFLGTSIIVPALVIGSVTFLLSLIGVMIGNRLRGHLDNLAEIVAGLILIALAIRVFISDII